MTQIEIIDRLCDITCRQAIAIKELTHIVNQSDTIDKETKKEINLRNEEISKELDIIEYGSRKII